MKSLNSPILFLLLENIIILESIFTSVYPVTEQFIQSIRFPQNIPILRWICVWFERNPKKISFNDIRTQFMSDTVLYWY